MNSYQTYLTIDHSQKIILSNLPFKAGTKLAINIQVVEDEKTEADFEALLDLQKNNDLRKSKKFESRRV